MKGTVPKLALRVENLRKAYKDVVAVDGLNLEVGTGECFGLLGPNGAGKTTTIEICEGLTTADSGDVEVLGMRWSTHDKQLRQRLGIQLQETQLAEKLTVLETVTLFRSFFHRALLRVKPSLSFSLKKSSEPASEAFLADRSNALRLPAPWLAILNSSSSMSRQPGSTRKLDVSYGTWSRS
jgi:ABC-type branched-subunit amino acid transport system ATPase component